MSNQGAASGALVSAFCIPEKISPIVHSLMNSVKVTYDFVNGIFLMLMFYVKCEEDDILQKRAGHSLGHLVVQCTTRKVCPNGRILQNLINGIFLFFSVYIYVFI